MYTKKEESLRGKWPKLKTVVRCHTLPFIFVHNNILQACRNVCCAQNILCSASALVYWWENNNLRNGKDPKIVLNGKYKKTEMVLFQVAHFYPYSWPNIAPDTLKIFESV